MQYKPLVLFLISFLVLLTASGSNTRLNDDVFSTHVKSTVFHSRDLEKVLLERKVARLVLGKTQQGRNIDAFFFPGTSNKRALIIGGMHGSELSSIEIAKEVLSQLKNGDSIFYSVIIIPSLFPDNAEKAKRLPTKIGDVENIGRYSYTGAIDPNRQMPTPGDAFDEDNCMDHAGRKMENETTLLLELISQYQPQRIVNLHAIRNTEYAGVFADPRTDHKGIALGYPSDSSLAITIAQSVQEQGGYIPGNHLQTKPTTLYYKDPVAVAEGSFQKRNFTGSYIPGKRGGGVSLGTWASTAVVDNEDSNKNRDAIRIITMEFPGSKRPVDYKKELQWYYQKQIEIYATALRTIFLGNYFTEKS